ncbi:MAG: tetratricopeptide repeat protein [Gomphosphaeria aponina SAG 52.96 = DSM 107014]|uniref:Tetratricopeptide repeat protein n=1 Tax=Gomphosphaeria aponina SAG 52.96 = DSM 107014 TaxID=1521640 RepID=A0A941GX85_9CHRO|nr:tetratricopeptide repeat protein [Gomphosphaeria aponina SAG 52.96 = DSM 107014]
MATKKIITKVKESLAEGNELKEQGKLEESIESYQKAIKLKPDYYPALSKLASIYETQENWEEAEKCYVRQIGSNPEDAKAYLNLARVLKKQNKNWGAKAAYQKAVELKEDWGGKIYKEAGDALLVEEDLETEAIALYQKAAANQALSVKGYYKLGKLLEKKERLDEASGCYEKAVELKPDSSIYYLSLGGVQVKQGKLEEAVKIYKKAIEVNNQAVGAYEALGKILKEKGKLDKSLEFYQKALEFSPDSRRINRGIGDILKEQGKESEAQAYYEKAEV